MTKEVCVFLADGFEEVEGLTVVDLLRRAGIDVCTVSIAKELLIHGGHGIQLYADVLFDEMDFNLTDMLVLPGGMPGTTHLGDHKGLKGLMDKFNEERKYIAAICAAPTVLGEYGYLENISATCYPGMENKLTKAMVSKEAVVTSGHIITSRGMGTAILFSLELITILRGKDSAEKIKKSIVFES